MKGSVRHYEGRGWIVQYYDPKAKKRIFKTFREKDDATIFQSSLAVRRKEGSLDARDYAKDQPLAFQNLADKWLAIRGEQVRCPRKLHSHLGAASDYFRGRNIKDIQYPDLEDFLVSLPHKLSGKTRHNYRASLHAFFTWAKKRKYISDIPEFPEIKFILGWRNTVDKETQQGIIEEVKRISYNKNPKIWIGIKWLATYVAIRPGELISIQEGDFDLSLGVVNVKRNKENKPKIVPMLDEDLDLVRSFPRGLPSVLFFRHRNRGGQGFGKDYLYSWWRMACDGLGITGIDLYGGTRHSSVRALREHFSPEQIKRGTMHATNSAFERYFQIELNDARQIYLHTSCIHKNGEGGKGKVLKIRN